MPPVAKPVADPAGATPAPRPPDPPRQTPLTAEELAAEREQAATGGSQQLDPEVAEALRHRAAVTGGDSGQGGKIPPPSSGRMREAKPEMPELAPDVAQAELDMMLASDPPPVERDIFHIKRLTDHYRALGSLPTPGTGDNKDDHKFHFHVQLRGLGDTEFERLRERAQREPTAEEIRLAGGILGKQRDPDKHNLLMVTAAMEHPAMTAPALLEKYGRPEDALRHYFNPGEIFQLASWVNDLSGWSNAAVERAKKS
jgi:hypothetical protein